MKLTNGGKPHICGKIQVHNGGPDRIYLCNECSLPVDKPEDETRGPMCMNCGSELLPRLQSRNPITGNWDKHSFYCNCTGEGIIINIG